MADKRITRMREIAKRVDDTLHVADIYKNDGAPLSAARCYREAADLLEQWSRLRDEILNRK